MNIFELFGKIGINNKDANKAIDETTGKAEKSQGKFAKVFSSIGNLAVKAGKVIATGLAAGATALGALSAVVVKHYADYEQLVGGVETLFGAGGQSLEEYAQSVGQSVEEAQEQYNKLMNAQEEVMSHAREAYKTAGLSANEYMETVTSFSASLIQSLGGDTEQAAKIADMAIVDMSDNANKMGTSMEAIQNAYNGFAKQNYTMLDNLKLGFGGTKEEMQRLLDEAEKISGIHYDISSFADITQAIHVMQEQMGIAGTTSKEAASTISGSVGMVKAAWENFLTGMADKNQNFDELIGNLVDSIKVALGNIAPRFIEALPRLVQGLMQLMSQLGTYLPEVLQALLPALTSGATELLTALIAVFPGLIGTLLNTVLPQVSSTFISFLDSIFANIPEPFQGLVTAFDNIKQIFVDVGGMVADFVSAFTGVDESKDSISGLETVLSGVATFLGEVTGKVRDFTSWLRQGGTSVDLLKGAVVGITTVLTAYKGAMFAIKAVETARNTVMAISNGLMLAQFARTGALTAAEATSAAATMGASGAFGIFNAVLSANPIGIVVMAIAALVAGLTWFFTQTETGQQLWQSFMSFLSTAWDGIVEAWTVIWEAIQQAFIMYFTALAVFWGTIWNGIMAVVGPIWDTISSILTTAWESISSTASSVFGAIASFLSGIWNSISGTVSSVWNGISSTLSGIFNGISSTVSSVWNGIKSTISNTINGAKDAVSNAINAIKGFFNFQISWPHIPMPHFSINPSGWQLSDLLKGSIPSLGIEFYAKGGIMTGPTLFGSNNGNAMIGGEAGSEAILPLNNKYLSQIGQGIADSSGFSNDEVMAVLFEILSVLKAIYDKDGNVYIDDNKLIGHIWKKLRDKFAFEDSVDLIFRRGT